MFNDRLEIPDSPDSFGGASQETFYCANVCLLTGGSSLVQEQMN